MISFSGLDFLIVGVFFLSLLIIGFIPKKEFEGDAEDYLLSKRKVGLFLFIMTNVSTWYGGILGVGEFTYRYGLLSWVTQGLPYYIFAILFALFFAEKIRNASLYTIPDKLEQTYGKTVGRTSSLLIFILVSPAPYLLMVGNLFSLILGIDLFWGIVLGILLSGSYLLKGGYKADLYTDVFQFFIMFIGFILAIIFSYNSYGGYEFLEKKLPAAHLSLSGGVSPIYLLVWFLIALWTFADPGFHQRCNAARDGKVAKWGIIISVFLWALFDFLTTTTGLYAKAAIPEMENPVLAFPLYAEKLLGAGFKGIFYAAMFATIISTLNSFMFLSATTFGRDFIFKLKKDKVENRIPFYTRIGFLVTSIIALLMSYYFQSVVTIWYLIGSICIPGIILIIIGSYFEKFKVESKFALVEIIGSVVASIMWIGIRNQLTDSILIEIEPMIVGLLFAFVVHVEGLSRKKGAR